MLPLSRLPQSELDYRNLYRAGQRRVADAKKKRKIKLEEYNARTFNQLELDLVRNPDNKKWLLDSMG